MPYVAFIVFCCCLFWFFCISPIPGAAKCGKFFQWEERASLEPLLLVECVFIVINCGNRGLGRQWDCQQAGKSGNMSQGKQWESIAVRI